MVNNRMNLKSWSLLILLSVIWGGSFFFNEILLRELQPLQLVMGRTTLAAVVLLIIVYVSGQRMPTSLRIWGSFAVMGLINNLLPFSLIVWGQQHITGGLASILNATTPLFTIVLAHFLTSEDKMTLAKALGAAVGFIGVIVLLGVDALADFGLVGLGQLAVLGAACSYSFAGIYGKRFKGMPSIIPAAGMLSCTALMSIPLVFILQRPDSWDFSGATIAAMIGLAVISTSWAYLIYFRLLADAGPSNALLVTFLLPISAIVLGVLFLNEQLTLNQFLGMSIIFLGLLIVDGRLPAFVRQNVRQALGYG